MSGIDIGYFTTREWLGNGPDRATLPECDLRRIARKMDQNIAKAERKYWRAYMGTKHGVFGDKEIEVCGFLNDFPHALRCVSVVWV